MTQLLGSFRLFLAALVLVVLSALLFAPKTDAVTQRIAHLESIVRCPGCDNLSVAQSNAPSAISVRHEIVARVLAGASDLEILKAIQAKYTVAILLTPPTNGLGSLLYLVPTGVIVVGAVISVRMVRRR